MTDEGAEVHPLAWASNLVTALNRTPLWVSAGIGFGCIAVAVLPGVLGVGLSSLHGQWSPYFLVSGYFFLIIAAAQTLTLIIRSRKTAAGRRRHKKSQRYSYVYQPLYDELEKHHFEISSTAGPRFIVRCNMAIVELQNYKSFRISVRRAWDKLFGSYDERSSGSGMFGDIFPIDKIKRLIEVKSFYCDDELRMLVKIAARVRIEGGVRGDYLTQQDIKLMDYIYSERAVLKKYLKS